MAQGQKRSPRNQVRRASLGLTAGVAAVALGLSGSSGACGGTAAAPSEGGAPPALAASHPAPPGGLAGNIDIARIMERVHFAFRPVTGEAGALAASHATYTVRADVNGAVTVTPARPSADRHHRAFGHATTFSTKSIGRGAAAALATDGAAPKVDDDGAVTIARGVADERWTNHDDGTRVAWAFPKKPAGTGDLLVRVGVTGTPFKTKSSGGAHFFDASSGLGLRFGRATWVDASGKGTDVAMEAHGDAIVLRVPSAVVEASSWPARLDPTVSPEIAVDDVVRGPETRGQAQASIATDGTDYFVVWTDDIYIEEDDAGAIRGTRITAATGAVLDVGGLDISAGKVQGQAKPHVAYDETTKQYVVAWANVGAKLPGQSVHVTRVLTSGTVVDSPSRAVGSIAIDPNSADPVLLNIACASGKCLVVAPTNVGTPLLATHNVVGIPLDLAATNPEGAQFTIAGTTSDEIEPAIAAGQVSVGGVTSAGALVTWRVGNEIHGRQVRFNGTLVGPGAVTLAASTAEITRPVVAYDGVRYLVVWAEQVDYTSIFNDIHGVYFADEGVGTPFEIAATFEDQFAPAVAPVDSSGGGFLVTWDDNRTQLTADIYGAHVYEQSIRLGFPSKFGPDIFQIATGARNETGSTVACATTNCFVAWQVTEPQPRESGGGLPTIELDYVVDPSSDIVGARVTKSFGGTPVLDPGGIVLSTSANGETGIVSASDGKSFMLAWNDSRNDTTSFSDVFGAIITPKGDTAKLITPTGIAIATASGAQQVAGIVFDGTSYLVVWNDESNGASQGDIYGRRFSPTGVALGANPFPISTAQGRQAQATIAFDKISKRTLVAWVQNDDKGGGIHASLVANDNTLVNIPTKGFDVEVVNALPLDLTAGSAGGGFLLAWSAGTVCGPSICQVGDDALFTVQIDSNGKVAPILRSAETGFSHVGPAIGSDGTSYLVAWRRTLGPFAVPGDGGLSTDAGLGIVVAPFASDGGNLATGPADAARFTPLVNGLGNVDPHVSHDGFT
jgi:hypothetical protein